MNSRNEYSESREAAALEGGSTPDVVRIGDTVRRPVTPRSPFVHELLRHIEAAGVPWSPRFIGIDEQDREILTFIEGDVCHEDRQWEDDHLRTLAFLIRQFHDATAGSSVACDCDVVCHNDLAPWNTVVRQGVPVAFIDFNDAAPGSRLDDLGYFLWVFLKLGANCDAVEAGQRMGLVCDAYGLDDQAGLLPAIERQQRRILAFRERQAAMTGSEVDGAWAVQRAQEIRRDIQWLADHHATVEACLYGRYAKH